MTNIQIFGIAVALGVIGLIMVAVNYSGTVTLLGVASFLTGMFILLTHDADEEPGT